MTTVAERKVIGKRATKVDALDRVTGKAVFGADFAMPGTLHGKVLRSPHPHAIIKKIDYSKALAVPGVKAVVTSADFPIAGAGTAGGELLINISDLRRLVVAEDKALFAGHPIAAVAATNPHIAEQALDLIQVDYEVLPPVENAIQGMQPQAPLLDSNRYTQSLGEKSSKPSNIATIHHLERGDVDKAFQECNVVIERRYETQMVHQGYIEPQACSALVDADGKITVWTTSQGSFNVKGQLVALLQLPQNMVKVVPLEIGGGFGGKIIVMLETLAVMLSKKSGRPVKMVMSREEVLKATGPGSPTYIKLKTGVKGDRLYAVEGEFIYDAGAFPGSPVGAGLNVALGPYKVENMRVKGYDVVTNKPRVQAYRAPGGTPAAYAMESQVDLMAEAMDMDPVEFRLRNGVQEGDLMANNQPFNRIGLKEVLERVKSHPSWNIPINGKYRGRGVASGFWTGAQLTSSAQVQVNADGTLSLMTGAVDLTGTRTTMQQICAEEFGVTPDKVHVSVGDTESVGYTDVSGGSRITYSMGTAVNRASQDAIAQMKQRAANQLKVNAEDIEFADGWFRVKGDPEKEVSFLELARTSRRGDGPIIGKGVVSKLAPAPEFAAHVVDVEVDPETGKVNVLNYTAFQDVGFAVNPTQVEGQMQGGASQGIGWALTEEYVWDKGILRNATLLDYRMPTALDLPMINTEIIEVPASDGPYGVRGVGEVPIVPPAGALANAVAKATGVRLYQLPMSPERVLKALRDKAKDKA